MPLTPQPALRRRRPTLVELVGATGTRHPVTTVIWRAVRWVGIHAVGGGPFTVLAVALVLPRTLGLLVATTMAVTVVVLVVTGRADDAGHRQVQRWRAARIRARWGAVMTGCGLADHAIVPKLRRVRVTTPAVVLDVRMAPGQERDDWIAALLVLGAAWQAEHLELAEELAPGWVRLIVARRDPLQETRPWPG